jgi:predicted kinase
MSSLMLVYDSYRLRRRIPTSTRFGNHLEDDPMLVSLSGLPGTGKTTLARAVAAGLSAVHLRIDTIEQATVDAGAQTHPVGPIGYYVARALAADHLRQGLSVIADCVNPLPVTRDMWRDVAQRAGVALLEVEVLCSDRKLHQERVSTRESDIPGLPLPTWHELVQIEYAPWNRDHLSVDTAMMSLDEAINIVLAAVKSRPQPHSL